jgi:hypothetical protein
MPIAQPPQLKAGLFARGTGSLQPPKKKTATNTPPPPGPKGVPIEHRIGIQAPAEVIWGLVYDLASWASWNPTYPKASGDIHIGSTLVMTLALPGQSPQQIRPVVLEWVPNEQLHWRLSMMGGLVKTTRYIEIEQLAEASCIVANGEIIGGIMGSTAVRRVGGSIRRGFTAMNEALKARAEAQWQAAQA